MLNIYKITSAFFFSPKKIFFVLLFLLSVCLLLAQEVPKSQVIIFTDCSNAVVKIGDQKISQFKTPFQFDTGVYEIKLWAPGRELVIDSVHILANQINVIRKKLPLTDDYKEYINYESRIKRPLKISSIFSLGIIVAYGFNHHFLNQNRSKANDKYDIYYNSAILPYQNENYNEYNKYKSKYERSRKINNALIIGGATLIPTSLLYSYLHYKKRNKKYETKEILLSEIEPVINLYGITYTEIGFRLKF